MFNLHKLSMMLVVFHLLIGCSSSRQSCEDINERTAQIAQCQLLEKQIAEAEKKSTLLKSTLEQRYQTDCLELRYHRDKMQPAICDNKKTMETIK